MELVSSKVARAAVTPAATASAAKAVTAFTADLFSELARANQGNLVCSPYSVAIALGMTATGARGTTAKQMLGVLHSKDAVDLADGLNALDQALATRSVSIPDPSGGAPQQVTLAAANSLWGQRNIRWETAFLDILARDFGAGMRVVDYGRSEAARAAINTWVSEQTRTRIPTLIPPGVITPDTRLTLVNALYLKAPWQVPFETGLTQETSFHLLDGSTVTAQLMNSTSWFGLAKGPNWTAANLFYAGRDLAMAVVVPGSGQFADVQQGITGAWLSQLLNGFQSTPVHVRLPRWTMRTPAELTQPLGNLGMTAAFGNGADFSGMTTQEQLQISAVVHEGYIAVDEAGTEAAAATAVTMVESAGVADPPAEVIADRPFFYVIHDMPTGTPLFIGKVMDPTVT